MYVPEILQDVYATGSREFIVLGRLMLATTNVCYHFVQRTQKLGEIVMAYILHSLCLVSEERQCKCGCSYITPSDLKLVLVSKNKRIYVSPPVNVLEFDLPHEARTFTVPIKACRACFTLSSIDQINLFGSREPEKYELFNVELEEFAGKKSAQKLIRASLAKQIAERMNHLGGKDKNIELVSLGTSSVQVTREKVKKVKAKKVVASVEDFF